MDKALNAVGATVAFWVTINQVVKFVVKSAEETKARNHGEL